MTVENIQAAAGHQCAVYVIWECTLQSRGSMLVYASTARLARTLIRRDPALALHAYLVHILGLRNPPALIATAGNMPRAKAPAHALRALWEPIQKGSLDQFVSCVLMGHT